MEKIRKDNESLAQLERALPAIVEAVMGKRSGVQQAGIVKDGSAYSYKDYGEKKAGGPSYDMAGLAKALKEEGIPPKALGIIQKAADDPAPALARGGLAVQQIEKIMKLLERFRRLTDSSP